jgi:hypothetical protein
MFMLSSIIGECLGWACCFGTGFVAVAAVAAIGAVRFLKVNPEAHNATRKCVRIAAVKIIKWLIKIN